MATVLILDDSATMVMSLARILKKAGYVAETCTSGQEGLDKLSAGLKPCAIITDLNMPTMDGISFIKLVRRMPSARFTPIVVLTTESGIAKSGEARAAGATAWLTKPTAPEELIATIKQYAPGA
jgi:two-component system chemotaxis response regulator CheY